MRSSDAARAGGMRRRGHGPLALAVVVLAACGSDSGEWGGTMTDSAGITIVQNPAEGNWTLQDPPELVEDLRIGVAEGDPEYQFARIASIDVDDDGTIYVLDAQARNVRAYDSEGRHLRTIGRPGTGPGELSQAPAAVLAGNGTDAVYVADMMRQRIIKFGADGTETGSTPLMMQNGIPARFQPHPDGRWAVQVRTMQLPGMTDTVQARDRILLRDPAGEAADTVMELESGRTVEFQASGMPRMRIFSSEPMWTVLADGSLAHGRNDTYRIELVDRDGTLRRVITRQVERKPVGESDRQAILRLLREQIGQQAPPAAVQQMLQNVEFADHYPTFFQLLGGPGNTLWVQRVATAQEAAREGREFDAQDMGAADWDVFDAEGRLLGAVRMPPRFMPLTIEGDHIYGVQRDELDVQHVLRLKVNGMME